MKLKQNKISYIALPIISSLILNGCGNENTNPNQLSLYSESSSNSDSSEWGKKVKELPSFRLKQKGTTLLSYLAFDNNKESERHELKPLINQHELAGSNENFNQVIFTDGDQQADTRRYFIVKDKNKDKIVSSYVQSKRDYDTGDYKSLAAFLKWGFSNYPAKRKIVDINDHGVAYHGIAVDDTSNSLISLPNLAKAIKMGAGKIDILNMDACLMSTIEVSYELRNLVDVIVSSEDNTLRTGMGYVQHLPEIIAKSHTNEEIAQNIVDMSDRLGKDLSHYFDPDSKVPNVFTISAVKESDMERLTFHLNRLSRMLLNKIQDYRRPLKTAFEKTHVLVVNKLDTFDMGQRDLYEVLARIEIEINGNKNLKDQEILNTIKNTREAANRAIFRARIHQSEKFAEGMGINISSDAVQSEEYKNTAFAKDTLWDELVEAINSPH